jgi:Tol biopolymer transport system component
VGPETIVFVSHRQDLWLIESDGTNPRPLTQDRWEDTLPRWSPDGSHIAFLSNRDFYEKSNIWIIDPVSGACEQITSNGANYFSWSPEGTRLAYSNEEGVWVVSLDGSPPEQIAEGVWAPEWSPDGNWLGVVGPVVEMEVSTFLVFSMVSLDDEGRLTILDFVRGNLAPDSIAWTRDGNSLVLTKVTGHRWSGAVELLQVTDGGIHYVDGVLSSSFPELSHLSAFTPRWSPDGERIVFAVARPGTRDRNGGIIYYAAADLTGITAITDGEEFAGYPDWSGDGNRLVFVIGEGRDSGLGVFDVRSGELHQLIAPRGAGGYVDWYP